MDDSLLFQETDPRGYIIALSSDRYNRHIVGESGHVNVKPEDIRGAIKHPNVIYQSSVYPSSDVYFAKSSPQNTNLYVKVAVAIYSETMQGDVMTAFLSNNISGGIQLDGGLKYVDNDNKL